MGEKNQFYQLEIILILTKAVSQWLCANKKYKLKSDSCRCGSKLGPIRNKEKVMRKSQESRVPTAQGSELRKA